MKFVKFGLVIAAFATVVGLAACTPEAITGPAGAPLVVVASSETPTSDLLTSYRRSITETGSANSDLFETFDEAGTLATANNGQLLSVVYSQDWYDALSVPTGKTRAQFAGETVEGYLPYTGPVNRICNAVFIDTSIPQVGRSAIFDAVDGYPQYQPGAPYQYRTYSADPGNELLTYADLCYGEGA